MATNLRQIPNELKNDPNKRQEILDLLNDEYKNTHYIYYSKSANKWQSAGKKSTATGAYVPRTAAAPKKSMEDKIIEQVSMARIKKKLMKELEASEQEKTFKEIYENKLKKKLMERAYKDEEEKKEIARIGHEILGLSLVDLHPETACAFRGLEYNSESYNPQDVLNAPIRNPPFL